jgi:PAS domain-containing protein
MNETRRPPQAESVIRVESTHMFAVAAVRSGQDIALTGEVRDAVQPFLEALPYYVILVAEDHTIVATNEVTQEALGMHADELIGAHCPNVVHGVDGRFAGCPLEVAVGTGRAVERVIFDETLERRLVSAVFPTRYVSEDGRRIYLHTMRDVTESRPPIDPGEEPARG